MRSNRVPPSCIPNQDRLQVGQFSGRMVRSPTCLGYVLVGRIYTQGNQNNDMVSRRSVVLGGGSLLLGGSVAAAGVSLWLDDSSRWDAGNVVVRNLSDATESVHVTVERWYESTECNEGEKKEGDRCFDQTFSERSSVSPDTVNVFEDAYSTPGQYRVRARASEDRTDADSNIELWTEDGDVTGMGTEVVVLPDGDISVLGFINSGTRNPPPNHS